MKHVAQPNGARCCGQVACAVLTGLPLAQVLKEINHDHGTKTKELIGFLLRHGWLAAHDRCIPLIQFGEFPEYALLQMRQEGRKSGWHWAVLAQNVVYDGQHQEALSLSEYIKRIQEYPFLPGRITSLLPLRKP